MRKKVAGNVSQSYSLQNQTQYPTGRQSCWTLHSLCQPEHQVPLWEQHVTGSQSPMKCPHPITPAKHPIVAEGSYRKCQQVFGDWKNRESCRIKVVR